MGAEYVREFCRLDLLNENSAAVERLGARRPAVGRKNQWFYTRAAVQALEVYSCNLCYWFSTHISLQQLGFLAYISSL